MNRSNIQKSIDSVGQSVIDSIEQELVPIVNRSITDTLGSVIETSDRISSTIDNGYYFVGGFGLLMAILIGLLLYVVYRVDNLVDNLEHKQDCKKHKFRY